VVISLLSHVLKVDLMAELSDLLNSLTAKRIVITGTDGYFAAGADIAELSALDGARALEYARFGQRHNRYGVIQRCPHFFHLVGILCSKNQFIHAIGVVTN